MNYKLINVNVDEIKIKLGEWMKESFDEFQKHLMKMNQQWIVLSLCGLPNFPYSANANKLFSFLQTHQQNKLEYFCLDTPPLGYIILAMTNTLAYFNLGISDKEKSCKISPRSLYYKTYKNGQIL